MHVDISPPNILGSPGSKVTFGVTVHNDTKLIAAYRISVLGVDPSWITTEHDALSLFPDQTRTLNVTLAIPRDFPAGRRDLAIQVNSLSDIEEFGLTQLTLEVEPVVTVDFAIEPSMVMGTKRSKFTIIVANAGNTAITVQPTMFDDEEITSVKFDHGEIVLEPKQQRIIEANVTGKRPWFASPAMRTLHFQLDGIEPKPEKVASFMQRPRIGRGLLSLMGLLAAAAVFATVLSTAFSSVVKEAKIDPSIIESALADDPLDAAGGAGTSSSGDVLVAPAIGGTVTVRGTPNGVAGATIELFAADSALIPVATAATDDTGAFLLPGLKDGPYKARITAAGFGVSWFARATSFEAATEVEVAQGDPNPVLSIEVGGEPGTIRGLIIGDDPSGATVRLNVLGELANNDILDPEVAIVEVTATGQFEFAKIPAPATYEIVVTKPGFAIERQQISVGAGEVRTRVEILLQAGDGIISGSVTGGSPAEALGGVTITATDGLNTFQTVSLTTDGEVGSYVLRELSTPGTYTVTFEKPGFTPSSQTISLGEGAQQEGVAVVLGQSQGAIRGSVSAVPIGGGGALATGGITVSATNGTITFTTTTLSIAGSEPDEAIGTYRFTNLPAPNVYTLTYSGPGLISQTQSVSVDGLQANINATLGRSTAILSGVVSEITSPLASEVETFAPTGGVVITVSNGASSFVTIAADEPAGAYEIGNLPAGTYTVSFARSGSTTVSELVTLANGELRQLNTIIGRQAFIGGLVQDENLDPLVGAEVRLFLVTEFPAGIPIAKFITGPDGRFDFPLLEAPQTYVVEYATSPGGPGLASSTVTLDPGEQDDSLVGTI